ncbi:GmrSD restriction endonuclease domain-containing protein [Aliarcobacter butzleri]|uniref:GmrSD restriction endonuclease domain-containing protein n=1 Tax=Aliarcobacter butzleri TaxID=28197 RepID=UPI003AF82B65
MSDVQYKGKITNFWQLLKEHNIVIPIIQRDYAQGRKDKEEIRDNFLNALFQSINTDTPIKLDFIYGSVEDGDSQPLDGQQRLTTLFLLHWYAAVKSQLINKDIMSVLKKFTYETRISSREFCNTLVFNPIQITKTIVISSQIVDSAWFFLSWKKDPTIDAMLRTLDDIHKYFFDIENLWEKLTSDTNLISFYHIELEDIGLTDDLYIKMNARGKLLSSFENFKASFQKRINDNKWDKAKEFQDTFAFKIDTKWTDLFWIHRKENKIDEAFNRFISTIAMCRQSINKTDNRLQIIKELQDKPDMVRTNMFDENDFIYLTECFDTYCKVFDENLNVKHNFPLFQHAPAENIFSGIVFEGQNASYSLKVLFYAQTEYLIKVSEFNQEKFQDWMRVVRNIVARGDVEKTGNRPTIIRDPGQFYGVINLIYELSSGCEDIYTYLSSNQIKSSFAKEQIEEEKLKAKLIVANPDNKSVIFNTEDTDLLQGKISFALYCIDYEAGMALDIKRLESVKNVISTYFKDDKDINNDLRRALLTIADNDGNYHYYKYWWSFWNVVNANKRSLIDSYLRSLEFYIYGRFSEEYKIYIKKLILKLMNNNLQEIVTNFTPPNDMPNWKIRLIKEPSLLNEMCKSNHIAIPEDEACCYLLKSMRPRDIDGCYLVK